MENSNKKQKSVEELAEEKYPMNKIEAIGTKQYVDEMIIIHNQRLAFIAGHAASSETKDELFRNFIRENSLSLKWEKYLSKQPNF